MKIRHGFVSNSSSSSFTCEISGLAASGWDMGLIEAGMYKCVRGHIMDEGYVHPVIDKIKSQGYDACEKFFADISEDAVNCFKENYEEYDDVDDAFDETYLNHDVQGGLPRSLCPICQLKEFSQNDLFKYLLRKDGREMTEIKKAIQQEFGDNPQEFFQFLYESQEG